MNKNNHPTNNFSISVPTDYGYNEILPKYGIQEFYEKSFYYQAGKITQTEGWIIHISIWSIHINKLFPILIPYLSSQSLTFKIPINTDVHEMLQLGHLGYANIGKIITIYPNPQTDIETIVFRLIEMTGGLKGPAVPTDIPLGNLVYIKYGSYSDNETKYISGPDGQKIIDHENIPYQLYPWIQWPFKAIPFKVNPIGKKIIQDRYLIRKVLKNDSRGFVTLAFYQKNFFNYKKCILKEGKMGMGVDKYGRDLEDRLIWQNELHSKLASIVPLPKVISLFKEESNTYLALEYIKGESLGGILNLIFEGNNWDDIPLKSKPTIVNYLIQITNIIKQLHQLNYVHRDLNVENFIVTRSQKVYVIDLELTFDLSKKMPNPPFEKGTEGYMSPEQKKILYPTVEQDIYSLGAIILTCLIQASPYKFNPFPNDAFLKKINFFCSDQRITELIGRCMNENPQLRPPLTTILKELEEFKVRTTTNPPLTAKKGPDKIVLKSFIEDAISTLANPIFTNTEGLWTSPVQPRETMVGNIRLDHSIFPGFRKGLSGILYLIGEAKSAGIEIKILEDAYTKNLNFLKTSYSSQKYSFEGGLYTGKAGIALGIMSLIQGGLLPNNTENLTLISDCLSHSYQTLEISNGTAGYGIALLKCADLMGNKSIEPTLNNCTDFILGNQLPNGSWTSILDDKSFVMTGFDDGIAGIIWYLLSSSIKLNNNEQILNKALHGLNYLLKSGKKYKTYTIWHLTSNSKDIYEFSNGGYKILLPFIKAYSITGDKKYKDLVESVLTSYPKYINADMLSIERGLSGLGEVYLEAWQAFHNEEWLKRAEWIAGVLMNSTYGAQNNTFWLEDDPNHPNADLLTGNSGIIHFLLRIYNLNNTSCIF